MCSDSKVLAFVKIDNGDTNSPDSQSYPDYKCEDFRDFDGRAKSLLKYTKYPPEFVSLIASKAPTQNAYFSPAWDNIIVGFRANSTMEKKFALDVFTHEFGHAIFNSFLARKIPIVANLAELKRKYNQQFKIDFPVYERLFNDPSCIEYSKSEGRDQTSDCARFIKAHMLKTQKERQETGGVTEDVVRQLESANEAEIKLISTMVGAYHELFADIVASVDANDPMLLKSALENLLGHIGNLECRSFSIPLSPPFHDVGPHCALSKIRVDLWHHWIVPNLDRRSKESVIQDLADILSDQAKGMYEAAKVKGVTEFDADLAERELRRALGMKLAN